MRVLVFVKMPAHVENPRPPSPEALQAMHAYNQELEKAGVLLDMGGLTPISRGVVIKYDGKKRSVIDGPFVEAKEMIAGYSLLEVKSLAEAVEWVKRAPFDHDAHDGQGVEVEIRPLFDPSEFDVPGEAEERAKKQAKS